MREQQRIMQIIENSCPVGSQTHLIEIVNSIYDDSPLAEVLRIFGQMANQLYPDLEYFDDASQPDTILDVSRVCTKLVEEIETARHWESVRQRIKSEYDAESGIDENAKCSYCDKSIDDCTL